MQLCQHFLRVGITAQFHHDPHAFAIAFVADVRDSGDFAVVDLFSQLLDPASFAELIRQLGDHHGIAFVATFTGLHLFDVGDPSHGDAAATVEVGVANTAASQHDTTCWEIRSGNELEKFVVAEVGIAHQGDEGIHYFAEVVGRNAGGHANGDARAAIQQQEGQLRWQNRWFLLGAVEVGGEVDRVVADFLQKRLMGDRS